MQVVSSNYEESWTYDAVGRGTRRSIKLEGGAASDYDYGYNAAGALSTLTYPVSTSSYRLKLQYLYQSGVLSQVKDFNAATVFWQATAMNPSGQVTQEQLGNGVVTNRSFDAVTGWVNSIQSGVGGGAGLQNESYLRDLVGNVTQRQNGNLGLTENFYYDNLYRLDYSTLQTGAGTVTNLDLSYDAMGNITSRSDIAGGAAWSYHASKKHAVTQAGSASYTFSYDANGNAVTRFGYNIGWTSYNYPSSINGTGGKSIALYYDANRDRYKQVYTSGSGTETTLYVGGLLEKVTAGGVTDWRHYVKVGSQTIALVSRLSNGTNTTRYVLEDNLGSPSLITTSGGVAYVAESFSAFGARRDPATWSDSCMCDDLSKIKGVSRRGFTGHEAIGGVSMGLNHMNGRVQDAITGRFLSPDPTVPDPGLTQSYNRYAYVVNNPLSYLDPTGFKENKPLHTGSIIPGVIPAYYTCRGNCAGMFGSHKENGTGADNAAAGRDTDGSAAQRKGTLTVGCGGPGEIGCPSSPSEMPQGQERTWRDSLKSYWGHDIKGLTCVFTLSCTMPGNGGVESILAGMPPVLAFPVGRAGEAAAGIIKNTERIASATGSAAYRIPDALNHAALTIGEVKNVASLSYTSQLRDFASYASRNGYTFELWVRPTTQLSGPLQQAVSGGEITLRLLP